MKLAFLILALLALLPLPAGAAQAPSQDLDAVAAMTTPPVTDLALIDQHFRQVLARPAFQAVEDADVNSQVGEWISQWFRRLGATIGGFKYISHMPQVESIILLLLVIVCVGLLAYILARLVRRRVNFSFEFHRPRPGQKIFRAPALYEEEIERAIAGRDWHAAWLASWRQFLSRLENQQLVEADRTRTNREYLAQLHAHVLPGAALALLATSVDAYDQFIYGRRPIQESDWDFFRRQMGEAALLLHLDDKPAPVEAGA